MYFWNTYSLVINWTPSLAANCYLCCFAFYHIYGSCYVKQLFLFFGHPILVKDIRELEPASSTFGHPILVNNIRELELAYSTFGHPIGLVNDIRELELAYSTFGHPILVNDIRELELAYSTFGNLI